MATDRKVPKTSQAPPPPPKIRGSYIPPKDKLADFDYWNLFPILWVHEAIYLTIGVDPRTKGSGGSKPRELENRDRFDALSKLSGAHLEFGSLEYSHQRGKVLVSEWLAWLKTVDIVAAEEWVAFREPPESEKLTVHKRRYEEAVLAINEGRKSGDTIENFADIRKFAESYPEKYPETVKTSSDETYGRSFAVDRAGNPFDDDRAEQP